MVYRFRCLISVSSRRTRGFFYVLTMGFCGEMAILEIMNRYFFLILLLFTGLSFCQGQIPVSQEPRHHNVFENDKVRVLDVHIPPGDTSLMHKHATPSVFIVLTNTKTGSEVLVEPEKANFSYGGIWFESFHDKPRIHRVWNSDTTEFHVIDMELPNKNPQPIDPPLDLQSFTLLFDEAPVRGYRFTLPGHGTIGIPERKAPIMVVGLSKASGKVTANQHISFVKKGDFAFIPAGNAIEFANKGVAGYDFALFELK
jgi:hypothetical protein